MRYSVDAIAWQKKDETRHYIIILRLNFPKGLAFPGGGIEVGESLDDAIVREVKEETGLTFHLHCWLPTVYNEKGRDPRGNAQSSVAYGEYTGTPVEEIGKTKVLFMTKEEILDRKEMFVFDHYKIFLDFLQRGEG